MLTISKDSHLDHGLTAAHIAWILQQFNTRDGFFIETCDLPPELAPITDALRGPCVGDEPVTKAVGIVRGERAYASRCVLVADVRLTRRLTVIAGPYKDAACMLYTAFGGPAAPKEPGELEAEIRAYEAGKDLHLGTLEGARAKLVTSEKFWSEHALAIPDAPTKEPVTTTGWYERTDGTWGRYTWIDGFVRCVGREATWAAIGALS